MSRHDRESIVLTLPADPRLARLARLVTLHFLRQNGVRAFESRRKARLVGNRCRVLLGAGGAARAGARGRARRAGVGSFVLTLTSGVEVLEVTGRRGDGLRRLVRLRRP